MGERLTVRLVGGGPWGFRLQGGSGAPLTVSKVRRKSRAQHHLVEGDRILSINGVPCDSFSYDQAMGVVDSADNSLKIEIIRGGASGKENRDPSAPIHQPKEVTVKENVPPYAPIVHTKPKEPVTKSPELHESVRLGPQSPKKPETTSQPSPFSPAKAPPPPPKPVAPPTSAIVAQPTFIPQVTSSVQQFSSSVQQISSSVSQVRTVSHETKSFSTSSQPPPVIDINQETKMKLSEVTSVKLPELPSFTPEKPQELSTAASSKPPEVLAFTSAPVPAVTPTKPPEVPPFASSKPPEVPPFASSKPPEVPAFAASKTPEVPAFTPAPVVPTFTPVKPPEVPAFTPAKSQDVSALTSATLPEPTTTKQPQPLMELSSKVKLPEPQKTVEGLAPELEALAPELAALDAELANFKSGSCTEVTPGDVQRRQEVSMETTSDGQRYHSLTSEKSSWSAGPQHKASSFQQLEETRQVSRTDHDMSRRVETVKAETKKEIFRSSQSEVSSAQKQLSPDSNVDALSWRPTSPIFSQPVVPPSVTVGPSTSPIYQIKKAPVQDVPAPAVWAPPSTSSMPGPSSQQQQLHYEQKKKKKAPPTLPKPIRKGQQSTEPRPTSAPPRDYDIWDPFSDSELVCKESSTRSKTSRYSGVTSASSGAVSDTEDWHQAYTSEDEMGSSTLYTRRKKMFSSSSFYEEPHSIYPTVEEQVELARKIAGSLSNDNNRKSKGANMFFKRVKRSHTWIHEGPDPYSDGGTTDTDLEPTTPDPATAPYIKVSSGPPKLKLILDPRQLQDLVKLRNSGLNPVDHSAVSPDICLDLVRDLNSPRGKGAALFAKRKQKAEEWVVDEEKVKRQLAQKEAEVARLYEQESWPPGLTPGVVAQNRLKMIKSPWEAALESPIGSCDAAFVELPPVVASVASSIIKAAENKARIIPAASSYTEPPFALQPDIYKPKAPRGWMGPATVSVPSSERNPEPVPHAKEAPAVSASGIRSSSGAPRPYSFHDFNTTARSWSGPHAPLSRSSFHHVNAPAAFK